MGEQKRRETGMKSINTHVREPLFELADPVRQSGQWGRNDEGALHFLLLQIRH